MNSVLGTMYSVLKNASKIECFRCKKIQLFFLPIPGTEICLRLRKVRQLFSCYLLPWSIPYRYVAVLHNGEESGESVCKVYTVGRARRNQQAQAVVCKEIQSPTQPVPTPPPKKEVEKNTRTAEGERKQVQILLK